MADLDPKLATSIKKTQDLLGKYVKKPPLSEKNLARPPFRFIHDVITTIIGSTGFLNGVLSPDEMDSTKITSKEAKNAFLQKIITAIKDATGEQVTAKISKILAGQEPDKTNELLQALARAIEKSGDGGKPAAGKPGGAKTKGKEPVVAGKDKKPVAKANPGKAESTGAKKPGQGAGTTKKGPNASTTKPKPDDKAKKTARDPSPATKAENKQDDNKAKTSRSAGKPSTSSADPGQIVDASEGFQKEDPLAGNESIQKAEDNKARKQSSSSSRGSGLKRQNSSVRMKGVDASDNLDESLEASMTVVDDTEQSNDTGFVENEELTLYDDFKNTSINPNMETLTVPTSPIIPESSVMMNNSGHNSPVGLSATNKKSANLNRPGPSSAMLGNNKVESQDGFGQLDYSGDAGPSNAQSKNRTGTATSRVGSSRPPSARPAPPRPRSSVFKETEELNYRPTTGKVSNVMLDSSDTQDDDDNFVIRETTVSKGLGLSDLDETPELALTSDFDSKNELQINDLLPPEQRGLLVNQILETQKELEDKDLNKIGKADVTLNTKSREVTLAEIEKLKNLIQGCARSANPLGKLLDYVREDMDAMQKELAKWRDEGRQLDLELDTAKKATEKSLQPLQQQLKDVDIQIQDKEDAIARTKMAILKHQDRIEKILTGLDRVQSSHGKISIPSASQLMEQKNGSSRSFLEDIPERPTSSNFGSALNRLGKGNSGVRPIFIASEELEDPDSFNPWKD